IGADAGSVKDTLSSADCLKAAKNSYLVFAHTDDMTANGGLPHVDYIFTLGLTNQAGKQNRPGGRRGANHPPPHPRPAPGVASQLSLAKQNATDNDNPTNFCAATMTYGAGDKGTPGKANATCP